MFHVISIHALREEGDPRPWRLVRKIRISIHALREEGDRQALTGQKWTPEFLSTPSARRATKRGIEVFSFNIKFLSTPSARRATDCTRRKRT